MNGIIILLALFKLNVKSKWTPFSSLKIRKLWKIETFLLKGKVLCIFVVHINILNWLLFTFFFRCFH